MNKEVEKSLLPRLSFLGYVLLVFSLIAFTWALLISPYTPLSVTPEQDLETLSGISAEKNERPLNIYGISAVFAAIGLSCLTISHRKKKSYLSNEEQPNPPAE